MKKFTIIRHGDGELANQLWNYVSIYACGLQSNARVTNPSFYEYHSFFKFVTHENILTKFLSKLFENNTKRKNSNFKHWCRKFYRIYSFFRIRFSDNKLIMSENSENKSVYLPPSNNHIAIDSTITGEIFFSGWLFRNPKGLEKYRKELTIAFSPNDNICSQVNNIISNLRAKYDKIIGVHIRQGDYRTFKGGSYLINEIRIRSILDEYIDKLHLDKEKTLFLLASDESIDENKFQNLNIYKSTENAITDLFLLSATDAIIGSNSTFGDFAAWYGNIPHLIATHENIDWNYYISRDKFFENKYCTMVHY